ncbi:MAG TPA: hypothetical protein VGM75_26930 [Pseudonocardiaceae bacterium]
MLHDGAADRVLAIWNPMGARKPGGPSLLGELDDLEPSANDVYGPCEKLLPDGRRLSSVSAFLRADDLVGEPGTGAERVRRLAGGTLISPAVR